MMIRNTVQREGGKISIQEWISVQIAINIKLHFRIPTKLFTENIHIDCCPCQ
jgi:hypothetical protein